MPVAMKNCKIWKDNSPSSDSRLFHFLISYQPENSSSNKPETASNNCKRRKGLTNKQSSSSWSAIKFYKPLEANLAWKESSSRSSSKAKYPMSNHPHPKLQPNLPKRQGLDQWPLVIIELMESTPDLLPHQLPGTPSPETSKIEQQTM